jgi:hypothetical protein
MGKWDGQQNTPTRQGEPAVTHGANRVIPECNPCAALSAMRVRQAAFPSLRGDLSVCIVLPMTRLYGYRMNVSRGIYIQPTNGR